MDVLKASVPLFIDVTGKKLVEETIRTHRDVADAIASRNPTAAHDAMYLHLVYNRNMIAEGAQAKSEEGPARQGRFYRSPFKSERSPIFRRIGASIPPLLLY